MKSNYKIPEEESKMLSILKRKTHIPKIHLINKGIRDLYQRIITVEDIEKYQENTKKT